MSEPTGEVVARPMVARACGCVQEFAHFSRDRFRAQRQAKFEQTRCPGCVAKMVAEQRAAAALPKKGEALARLPPGAAFSVVLRGDGRWAGTLSAGGSAVEASGDAPWGVAVALARLWAARAAES